MRRTLLTLVPFAAGIATTLSLWGDRAEPIFFATTAEVIALGAVAMALQGGFFSVAAGGAPTGVIGRYPMAVMLIGVGVGLAFAFGALARGDGGGDAHLALSAGGLAMGIAAFAVQALFGRPAESDGTV